MLEIIITALLTLGFISNPNQANQEIYNQNQTEVEMFIIETEMDSV